MDTHKKITINAFDTNYLDLLDSGESSEDVSEQIDFILKNLKIEAGSSILDVGCGDGRHSIELARRGFLVTGLDTSPDMIDVARANASKQKYPVKFISGSITSIRLKENFDVVLSLFSYGFSEIRDDALRNTKKMSSLLKPNGKFFLVTTNGYSKIETVLKNYKQQNSALSFSREREFVMKNKQTCKTTHTFTFPTFHQVMRSHWGAGRNKKNVCISSFVFMPQELFFHLIQSHLEIEKIWGVEGFKFGAPFKNSSSLILIQARKI